MILVITTLNPESKVRSRKPVPDLGRCPTDPSENLRRFVAGEDDLESRIDQRRGY